MNTINQSAKGVNLNKGVDLFKYPSNHVHAVKAQQKATFSFSLVNGRVSSLNSH
jgi:hypothetical protein